MIFKNVGFYLLYATKARFLELGLMLELFDNSELAYVFMNLSGVYEVLRINYSYLFQSFPADFMEIWNLSPNLFTGLTLTEQQKELLVDYMNVSIKQDYYKNVSELFLFFNINGIFKERDQADYELIFEERFKNYVKGPKYIGYDEFIIIKDTIRNQEPNAFLTQNKSSMIALNKIIKRAKDSNLLSAEQIVLFDNFYKVIIKNSLVFFKLMKTSDYSQFRADVRFDHATGIHVTL